MPQCAFHPGVETNVRCVQCDRYMCPKDYVPTPVGYKCKECARQLPSARRVVKPKQLALALAAALGAGIAGAVLVRLIGYGLFLVPMLLGILTAEAARRASGGHREIAIAVIAGAGVLIGCVIAGLGIAQMAIATVTAVVYTLQNRW